MLAALSGAAQTADIPGALGLVRKGVPTAANLAVATTAILVAVHFLPHLYVPSGWLIGLVHERLLTALAPSASASAVVLIVGEELFFRGFLQRRFGAWLAGIAAFATVGLTAPVAGAFTMLLLGVVAHRAGSVLPTLAARLLALAALAAL
jgi:membrane protease YdiL (CAAX protease family)